MSGLKTIEDALLEWVQHRIDEGFIIEKTDLTKQALAECKKLREKSHPDLKEIIETAQKTGWQYESDLGVITTGAAKALHDFIGHSSEAEMASGISNSTGGDDE